ncbi:MDR family oxidoreductase [Enterovirga rhinocerotis]|uniref:Acrylyl-CoA reductase (NADPH) n=1 Tax=Enterovirga rhinocerotis TaxID=1339210 RepID=A0A4R7BVI1_9HYPH|nr:MDR family oxidoreductase [Enterovirga rhinocerotis]TDR89840.1 acrylyl-CoA reductase (NADPH) [Enterovirga rhinocerotis]
MTDSFRALVATQAGDRQEIGFTTWTDADLPAGDVTVAVEYSSFNYKDGLALAGKNRILRKFPIVPGIDFAGRVLASDNSAYAPGDRVILTGWGVGEGWSGGFAERARVKGEWLVKLPSGMSSRHAMAIGTAGLTAMLCVMALEAHGLPDKAKILVTGASGGVGSVAVKLLADKGHQVSALTGRREEEPFLRALGAVEVIDRAEYASPGKPLAGERWNAAVDTVGSTILANVLAAMAYRGAVAACGLAGGMDLPTTVFPFILRNVALLGVDSVQCPKAIREEAWTRLAADLTEADLAEVTGEVPLDEVTGLADRILKGQVRGRQVVRVLGAG